MQCTITEDCCAVHNHLFDGHITKLGTTLVRLRSTVGAVVSNHTHPSIAEITAATIFLWKSGDEDRGV